MIPAQTVPARKFSVHWMDIVRAVINCKVMQTLVEYKKVQSLKEVLIRGTMGKMRN
jgi:hypothetical protein